MAQTIKLRRSAQQGAVPTTAQLDLGEVAINTYDGKLFIKKNNGTESIVEIGAGGGGASVTVSDTKPASSENGDLWWDSTVGTLKIYYTDSDGSQWIDAFATSFNPIYNGVDGGFASSVYVTSQSFDGGSANG